MKIDDFWRSNKTPIFHCDYENPSEDKHNFFFWQSARWVYLRTKFGFLYQIWLFKKWYSRKRSIRFMTQFFEDLQNGRPKRKLRKRNVNWNENWRRNKNTRNISKWKRRSALKRRVSKKMKQKVKIRCRNLSTSSRTTKWFGKSVQFENAGNHRSNQRIKSKSNANAKWCDRRSG